MGSENEREVQAFVWEVEYRTGSERATDDTVTLSVTNYRPDIYGGATPIDEWTLDVDPLTDEPRTIEDSLADLIGKRNARSAMEKALRRDLWPV